MAKKRSSMAVPLFGVELLGQIHRPLHIGEEDGHLLALAFEGGLGGEDLLGEVSGGVGLGGVESLSRCRRGR